MDKSKDNDSGMKTQYFSLGDILALGLMVASGLYFLITSALKIADLFFSWGQVVQFHQEYQVPGLL